MSDHHSVENVTPMRLVAFGQVFVVDPRDPSPAMMAWLQAKPTPKYIAEYIKSQHDVYEAILYTEKEVFLLTTSKSHVRSYTTWGIKVNFRVAGRSFRELPECVRI